MAKQQLRARELDYAPEHHTPNHRRPQHRAGRLSLASLEQSGAPSPIPTPAQKARRPSVPSLRVRTHIVFDGISRPCALMICLRVLGWWVMDSSTRLGQHQR
jgi:hypothetical protein